MIQELTILKPDLLITQGKTTNEIMGDLLVGRMIIEDDLPRAFEVNIGKSSVLWLPMRHPTQQLAKIRNDWPFYNRAVRGRAKV